MGQPQTVIVSPRQVQILRKGAKAADESVSIAAVIVVGGQRTNGADYVGWVSPSTVGVVTRAGKRLMRSDIVRVAVSGGTEVAPAQADAAVAAALAPRPTVLGGEVPINLISNGATTEIADTELNAGRTSSGVFKDDFLDELHARTKAQIGPNGELLDDFDQLYQLQKGVHEELNATAPFTRTNPPSILQGVLGNQILVQPDGNPVILARWDATSDAETCAVVCQISPIDNLPNLQGIGAATYRPYGIVLFGTRGIAHRALFDIGAGTRFVVNGSSVVLSVAIDQSTGTPLTAPLLFTGSLSFTPPMYSSVGPTKTLVVSVGPVGGGANGAIVPIPAFAKSFTVWRDTPSQILNVFELDYNHLSTFFVQFPALNSDVASQPIPISGFSAFVEVLNTSAGSTNVYLIFNLDL